MHFLSNARRLFLVVCAIVLLGIPNGDIQANVVFLTIDSAGDVGRYSSLALTSSGNPVVSYYDATTNLLKLAICTDPMCSGVTLRNIDAAVPASGEYSSATSVALTSSDNPVVSYYDAASGDLKLAVCTDPTCDNATLRTVDSMGNVGWYTSLALTSSGNPVISYFDATNGDLKLAVCTNPTCDNATLRTVDSVGYVGTWTSLALTSRDNPVISYNNYWGAHDLKLAVCADSTCGNATLQTVDSEGWVGYWISLVLTSSGNPVISYSGFYTGEGSHDLKLAVCADPTCGNATLRTVDSEGIVGGHTSIKLNSSGNPVISYYDATNGDLKLAVCSDAACSIATIGTVDSAGQVGWSTSLELNSSGNPVISYYDVTNGDLRLAICDNPTCGLNTAPVLTADAPIVTVAEGQTATNTGMVTDADGDTVALTASIGTVNVSGNTWTWQFQTSDGPAESQTVTISGDDRHGGTHAVSFMLNVDNVPPTVEPMPAQTVYRNETVAFASGVSDPGTLDTYTYAWQFGDGSPPSYLPTPTHVYEQEGDYTVSLTVTDKDGGVGSTTTTVTVLNQPPEANDDSYTLVEDTELSVDERGVLMNDSDPENDGLLASLRAGPSNGVLTIVHDGSFSYIPNPDFNGTDSFTYQACDDPHGGCDSATVTLAVSPVNDPPVANDDQYATSEDTAVVMPVLANDLDVDNDLLSVTPLSNPVNGALMQLDGGSFSYMPNVNFYGSDSFTYQACDPAGLCDQAMVMLTINPVNDVPVCDAALPSLDFLWPPEHQMVDISILGVTDVEGDPITITVTSIRQDEPTNGTGDGDLSPDGQGIGTSVASVRAERAGDGDGRMYHISFTADDGHSGTCTGTVLVGVRHDQGRKGEAVDGGPLYDSTQP